LREYRGAEDPKTEEKLDSLLHRKRQEWIETAKSQAQRLLENARLQLRAKGVSENTVTSELVVLDHKEDLIGEILETASRDQCGTIIVGQSSFPWFKELFASHTGEELLIQSEGFAIC
jgi:nucleotide-binding universal stress UspA family protein